VTSPPNTRPLVLLDVDGVLHDRRARDRIRISDDPEALAVTLGVHWASAGGIRFAIPYAVTSLILRLVQITEVWWCTTWGDRANEYLAPVIGIEALPVVGAGTRGIGLSWKVEQARQLIEAAVASGRRVIWIEDFDGAFPDLPQVEFVDTAATGLVSEDDLPPGLL